ncbi:MAG: hypothetical protein JWL86_5201 [Rhizobium sp.]|nr:hypothetical protein [Rhizobium sp.]
MDVQFLSSQFGAASAQNRVEQLVGAIGSPVFDEQMIDFAVDELRCSHVTAFTYCDNRPPRMLLAVDRGEPMLARRIAAKYISEYWDLDPANKVAASEPRVGEGATIRLQYEEIEDAAYRRDCYRQARLVDRFSLIKAYGKQLVRVNLYRDSTRGRFCDSDLTEISKLAGLLMQIVVKHDQLRPTLTDEDRLDAYRTKLRYCDPLLSDREIQICAEIVMGRTSEAIANKLGLSINTILTHRKRAYAKLEISSQNELSRIVLQ